MSFNLTDTDDSAPLHVSAACSNQEAINVLSKSCCFKQSKNMYCHTTDGSCTKWQNL